MEELWTKACRHYALSDDVAKTWYTRIKERLSEKDPNRVYHNWNEMMLLKQRHMEQLKPSLVLAAFFQYYHFDGNLNCDSENCRAFEEFCSDALFEDESAKCSILKLLGDKRNTEVWPSTELAAIEQDGNLLQDLDLIILAAPAEEYKHYTQLLRREYASMSDHNYKLMRLKVLETLLMIPNIYSTKAFQTDYEEAARVNIKSEIDQLKI